MMRTENGEVIDPTYQGNIARFINHSCDPNCITRKWTVMKETMVGIFARREIAENEELSFDYQFDSFRTPFTKCYCGAKNCKGYLGLGMYDDSDSDVEEKRATNSPDCLQCGDKIMRRSDFLLCRGKCRSVFHLNCAKDVDPLIRLKIAKSQFQPKKYVCFRCVEQQGNQSDKTDALPKPPLSSMEQASAESILDDPECQKFFADSQHNSLLDRII